MVELTQNEYDPLQRLILPGWRDWQFLFGYLFLVMVLNIGYFISMEFFISKRGDYTIVIWGQILHLTFALLFPQVYRISHRYRFNKKSWPLAIFVNLLVLAGMFCAVQLAAFGRLLLEYNGMITVADAFRSNLRRIPFYTFSTIMNFLQLILLSLLIRWHRQRRLQESKAKVLELHATRLKSQLVSAKLQALRMQLHPHFFFNTLNSISSLVRHRKNDEAYKTISLLGSLLRSTLELSEERTISLQQELSIIRKYLGIETVRFPERLKVSIKVPKICLPANVPALILQPLVENCIRHGVANKKGLVTIEIVAENQGKTVKLYIRDDGMKLPADWSIDTHGGVGLKNVRERLRVMYGEAYTFRVMNREPTGVTVQLELPFKKDREH